MPLGVYKQSVLLAHTFQMSRRHFSSHSLWLDDDLSPDYDIKGAKIDVPIEHFLQSYVCFCSDKVLLFGYSCLCVIRVALIRLLLYFNPSEYQTSRFCSGISWSGRGVSVSHCSLTTNWPLSSVKIWFPWEKCDPGLVQGIHGIFVSAGEVWTPRRGDVQHCLVKLEFLKSDWCLGSTLEAHFVS